jgi:hypothetical protein
MFKYLSDATKHYQVTLLIVMNGVSPKSLDSHRTLDKVDISNLESLELPTTVRGVQEIRKVIKRTYQENHPH